ncbi:MAG: sel1 repeat family protein [Hyphomicrobiales bacterium]
MARFELDSAELSTIGGRALSPEVFFELGMMYSCGRDVEINLVAAHKWFNLAAMAGSEEAKEYRTEISSEMTKAEKAKALKSARNYMNLH